MIPHAESGFALLDGAGGRSFLFQHPSFHCLSLDELEAALCASAHSPDAKFVGFLSFDVAEELENIGHVPSGAPGWPRTRWSLYQYAQEVHGLVLPPAASFTAGALCQSTTSVDSFQSSVRRIVGRIRSGDFFQTNLCRRLEAPLAAEDAWPLYCRLRELSPAEYGAFLQYGDGRALLSISPELFLRVRGGVVESRPIKGTRRRGCSPEEDEALKADLLNSAKDRAELAMIVDVTRNDLSRVCLPGSVRVESHAQLVTLPTLHHTYSRVTGVLRPTVKISDLLRATFPPASITGAPKIAATEAVLREEGCSRGPCMGAIGWISPNGDMELSVAIRTAFTDGGKVTYLAGCGITAESDPEAELRESQAKARAFVSALGLRAED